jgi:hypothetical protein
MSVFTRLLALKERKGKYNQVTIKKYSDGEKEFYKLTYLTYQKNKGIEEGERDSDGSGLSPEELVERSIYRTRNKVFEYAACNKFQYFVTLTLDGKKVKDRDERSVYKSISQWLNNYKKRKAPDFQYILIPEKHKKGGYHFHGLINGIPEDDLESFSIKHTGSAYINNKVAEGNILYDWTPWRKRFGFNDIEPIRNKEAVEKYITKYITKTVAENQEKKGDNRYFCSKGLKKAEVIKSGRYTGYISPEDDSFFDFVNDYISTKTVKEAEVIKDLINKLVARKKAYKPITLRKKVKVYDKR